ISIFLGIGFVLIFFMNLVSTTGFFSAGAMILPSTLPFSKTDLEGLMLLAFARIFIAPIAMLLVIMPTLVSFVLGVQTGIFVLVSLAAMSILALGALIRVSGWFYSKSQSGDESVLSTIVRIGTGIGMMVGILVAYGAIGYIPAIVDFIIAISSIAGPLIITLLALVFPFSFGFVAATFAYGFVFTLPTIIASILASAFYFYLGVRTYHTSGRTLKTLALGGVAAAMASSDSLVDLTITSELLALIRKDLRVATRSLGSAMLLVFPFLMIFALWPSLSMSGVVGIRSMNLLMVVGYSTVFAGLAMIGLLGLDTQGASVYEGIPLRTMQVLNGKIAIFSVSYIFTMILVLVIILFNTLTSPFLLLIPLFQIPCSYSIGAAIGGTIYLVRGGGRVTAVNLVGDQAMSFLSLIVSCIVGLSPLGGYALTLLNTGDHLLSVLVQLLISFGVAAFLRLTLPRVLKD
ncbi:MAG: hypothetical protein ACFFDR_01015, partial [Candidatus Thorarchaeota archaeon]